MNLSIRLDKFYSQSDEDRFFSSLSLLPAVTTVQGVGRDLLVDLDLRRLHRGALLDLIALLHRYAIALAPLGMLAKRRRFAWLRNRAKYWYKDMFPRAMDIPSKGGALWMLFTIVMEYRGGTYISQVTAHDVAGALHAWAAALNVDEIAGLGPRRKAEIIDDLGEGTVSSETPVVLDGLSNAWCTSALTSGGLALINIVATVSDASKHSTKPAGPGASSL